MNLKLRAANVDDAERVAEVLLSSRKEFLPYARSPHTETEVLEWVRKVLIPSGGVTVACVRSSIVGVLATAYESGVSWINQLYVAPSHVGRGIGSRLLTLALGSLAPPVRLYTFQANVRARSFYERRGFKAVEFGDGSTNEERGPDVLYEFTAPLDGRAN